MRNPTIAPNLVILFSISKASFLFFKDFISNSLSILNFSSLSSNLFPSIKNDLFFILKLFGLFKERLLFLCERI